MDDKGIRTGMCLAMMVLILSSSLSGPVKAQSLVSKDSKPTVAGGHTLQEEGPSKCPNGQDCPTQSQIQTNSDTTHTGKSGSFPSKGLTLVEETKESNSGISNEETERAMNDAPLDKPASGAGTTPSRSKSRPKSKSDKKLRRKNRRRKCRERRRKRRMERKMKKGGGKGKAGGKGIAKRRGKKGRKNKRKNMKCGRKMRKKGRKRNKNEKKGLQGILNKGNDLDSSNATLDSFLDTISKGQKPRNQKGTDVSVLGSEVKNIETKSQQPNSDSSTASQNSESPRQTNAGRGSEEKVIDSDSGVADDNVTSSTNQKGFNAIEITALFHEALRSDPGGDKYVDFDSYVKAYGKLTSVFDFFGTIFSFAKSDLEDKINTLGEIRRSSTQGQNPESYNSFKSMFEYEYSNGIAKPGGGVTSAVRENAWIHRALKFIIEIVRTIADKTETSPLSSRVKEFYTDILAPHHSWLVRMGVYTAIYSFPSRETLLKDMKITDNAEGMRELTRLAESLQAIYDLIQVHYETYAPPK